MDSRTGIYLARNKRTKFNNEDMDCSYPDYNNSGEELTPAKVIDYSNVAALPKVLADYSDGKYGSVTKECNGLHDQVIQLLSVAQRLTFSPPGLASCSSPSGKHQMATHKHKSSPISKNVIDLDFDPPVDVSGDNELKYKEEKSSRAVIVLDSDDDEGDCQVGAQDPCGPVSVANHTSAMFESHLQMFQIEAMLPAQENPYNQLVPYEQGFARLNSDVAKGRRTPNIEFEQVILRNTTEEHRTQGLVEVRRGQKETGDLHHDLKTKSSVVKVYEVRRGQKGSGVPHHDVKAGKESNVKKSAAKRGKKESYDVKTGKESHDKKYVVRRGQFEGEDLHHDVKTGKESDVGYYEVGRGQKEGESLHQGVETEKAHVSASPMSFMGTEDMGSQNEGDIERAESDGLDDLWNDMSLAMEYSKTATSDDESVFVQNEEECNHSYLLEDDIGLVCRVCGVIQKSIETIFDYQWTKGTRSTRTYPSGSRPPKDDDDAILLSGPRTFERDLILAEIFIHPRHAKQMRPHQSDGFNFLVRNLVTDKPGGCILAHAPGSGKTFMLISFIQSFLAKYPDSRPLIILPKGILSTWKKEFQRWQVEDIPLYDFYSSNASNRSQQLEILRIWEEKRGILFLGYKQFSSIVIGGVTDKISSACQERLLKVPSLLILDEGHTPRNECTDMLNSIAKVQTPRKVVLSGTLFQNHVKEVFNILNLVRPKFLKMETSRAVVKRVLSRVHISASRRLNKGSIDSLFYESIEDTLQNDDNEKRKVTIIQDLREMTKNVLHYYKGDFLDELPGLVDFTVLLKLSWKQKEMVEKLGIFEKFKKSSVGKAIYVHPHLKDIAEHAGGDKDGAFNNDNIDRAVASMNLRDGVKAKFFFTLLSMCESNGEKLLVFSQYLLPMKFLERLVAQKKGWCSGKEIFMITGDSSPEQREWSMEQFNKSPDAKVFFGSIKACGEGISLVGASRIIILDVHLNPSVTRQAIGRAFRPGQLKKVYTYRLVAADSPEEDDHRTAFRKELISKMWFEWSEYCGDHVFELGAVDIASCEDVFFENPVLGEDVQDLYSR